MTVCTGNLCRSPYAELRLATVLRLHGADVEVVSAGLRAKNGLPYHAETQRLLAEFGIDGSSGRSTYFTPALARDCDAILTATVAQRDAVAKSVPRLWQACATFRQAAVAAEVNPSVTIAQIGRVPMPQGVDLDVADPMGLPAEAFNAMADDIDALVPGIVDVIHRSL